MHNYMPYECIIPVIKLYIWPIVKVLYTFISCSDILGFISAECFGRNGKHFCVLTPALVTHASLFYLRGFDLFRRDSERLYIRLCQRGKVKK